MKKLLLLIGILVLILGCSPEPEIIYQEVVVTATPTYPLYTSGEARALLIEYMKADKGRYEEGGRGSTHRCYQATYKYKTSEESGLIGKFEYTISLYDATNYAWTLTRYPDKPRSWLTNYKWTLYERTGTISSDHPGC